MKHFVCGLICLVLIGWCAAAAVEGAESSKGSQAEGIAYGNVLEEGWSCIYQWYKGAWGRTHYRRQIVDININRNGASVVFSNGSQRNLYNIAIINNVNTTSGSLAHWQAARKHPKDSILLNDGTMVHGIISGYDDGLYLFKDIDPIHRDSIRIVYPNPSVPLARRL